MPPEQQAAEKQQLAVVPPKPPQMNTDGFSMLPRTFEELKEYCRMIASSGMVPKDYVNNPGGVLVAIQMGGEVGLKPLQSVQNIAVINARPSIYGDLGKAILRSHGIDIEEADIEEIRKTQLAWCLITRKGQAPVRRTFSIEDAKTAGLWGKSGPWTNHPFRQMAWRAFWFAARDAASDLLKGLSAREEIEDIIVEALPPTVTKEELSPGRASAKKKAKAVEGTVIKNGAGEVVGMQVIPDAGKKPEPTGVKILDEDPSFEDADDAEPAKEEEPDGPQTPEDLTPLLDTMQDRKIRAPQVIAEMKKRFDKNALGELTRNQVKEMTTWVSSQPKKS